MANKLNQKNLPWFPFYSAAWLGSSTVTNMTMTERGIYVSLMAMCWQYGSVPWDAKELAKMLRIDRRVVGRFVDNYTGLTQTLHEGSTDVTFLKLQEFASTLRKSEGRVGQMRGDNTKQHDTTPGARAKRDAGASVGVLKTKTKAEAATGLSDESPETTATAETPFQAEGSSLSHHQSETLPKPNDSFLSQPEFDPSSYAAQVGNYSAADVHRILSYHFVHHPSAYWTDPVRGNITSPRRLAAAIGKMAVQVPADWSPPVPKPVQTRTVGDPSCKRCRGRGRVAKQDDRGTRTSVECNACVPRRQIAKGCVWVDCS